MAPIQRIAHQGQKDQSILHELIAIRNSLQLAQQSLNRLEHRYASSKNTPTKPTPPNKPPTKTPARQLLENIANQPIKFNICWYHKMFGAAANTKNCPGPLECKFRAPKFTGSTAQSRIKKIRENDTPIRIRPATATSVINPDETNLAQTKQSMPSPVCSTTNKINPTPSMDWSNQCDTEQRTKQQQEEELERELLDVSP